VIEIYGLGYVGLPLAIGLAISGLMVTGIDKDIVKIKRLKNLELFESELNLEEELSQSINSKNLSLVNLPYKSEQTKVGIICVPTPIPTSIVSSDIFVNDAVNSFLSTSKKGDIIILESSIEIGTTEKIRKTIESKGYTVGKDFGLAFCPERIDPQNKKWNLENIPRIIYCSDDTTYHICQEIYRHVNNTNLIRVSEPKVAEVVKSFENAFRLVNISLVNELAVLCDKLGINVKEVIDAAATKPFGFMPFYPGAGAGGHCIPKDPRFLLESSKKFGIEFKTLQDALDVNSYMPEYIAETIVSITKEKGFPKSVLVCGLAYKPDIEDMRDSPGFKIVKAIAKKGLQVTAYDPYYKQELQQKYMAENHMDANTKFDVFSKLQDKVGGFGCICIVQHHTKTEYELREIYRRSLVPFIYDCQGKIDYLPESKTLLKKLGS
jgi:UDP-N-acetyl-D-glucosamine dehydrogenase